MQYIPDHDLHIHSKLSSCSRDPAQTPENILRYALENGLKTVCLTDHYWDETVPGASGWYAPQDTAHLRQSLPLPQAAGVRFLFGCETELRRDCTLGISRARFDELDFVVIPTTHLHMNGFTVGGRETAAERAELWVRRLDALLSMDLPFRKIGVAHPVCGLIAPTRRMYLKTLRLLPETELERLFAGVAALGAGVELNADDFDFPEEEAETVLRPFLIAKRCGCKFYCGSDAHKPADFSCAAARFARAVRLLDLTEEDKFIINGEKMKEKEKK